MDDETHTEYGTSTLLRVARSAYTSSVRAELYGVGIHDLPRNGAVILAGIAAGHTGPRPDLPGDLGVTKQAISQVTDILVSRGYVVRGADPQDRRRVSLELTERGREAAAAVLRGVTAVDEELAERIGAERMAEMRSALEALAEISLGQPAAEGRRGDRAGRAAGRADRLLRQFQPIFPVRDLKAALAHYAALGFHTHPHADGDSYGFANRDRTGLHLHESTYYGDRAAAYLYVRDADALYQEWSQPGIGGHTSEVHTTDYGMREGSHQDPDGNVIRFGSDIREEADAAPAG